MTKKAPPPKERCMIEYYGRGLVRIGVEFEWAVFIVYEGPRPKRKELMQRIVDMDRQKHRLQRRDR